MHEASMRLMKAFLKKYGLEKGDQIIIDIGSLDINGSYRELTECMYIGTDIRPGKNVDVIIADEDWNLLKESVDAVICGQTLEHVKDPVLLMRQCYDILKPGGLACFIVPTCGDPHYYSEFYGNYSIERMKSVLEEADCFTVLEMYLDEGPNTNTYGATFYLHDLVCIVLKGGR